MDINWLEDFICLARTLNFTRAAAERNITQSAFSRRIKALEHWTGTPLIDRTSYPAKLSEAGESFLPTAESVVRQLLETRDDLRARDRGGLTFCTFAAPHSISINQLPSLLRALARADRAARSRVLSDNLHACCQLLADGAADFLMCYRHPNIPVTLDERRFARLDLGQDRLVPLAAPDPNGQPLWRLPGSRAAPVPYLAYARDSFLRAVVDEAVAGQAAWLDVRHMDAFTEALKSVALQHGGVAWLPESTVARELAAGELVRADGGDGDWDAVLTISVFAAIESLDAAGRRVWAFLADTAAAPDGHGPRNN